LSQLPSIAISGCGVQASRPDRATAPWASLKRIVTGVNEQKAGSSVATMVHFVAASRGLTASGQVTQRSLGRVDVLEHYRF